MNPPNNPYAPPSHEKADYNSRPSDAPTFSSRPKWEETCHCIRVCCDTPVRGTYEPDDSYQARHLAAVRNGYLSGNDWTYLVDCPDCIDGKIIKTKTNLTRLKAMSENNVDEASDGGLPPCTGSPSFEDVTLDELSARYMRILTVDSKKGYCGTTPENHFQLALLYLATERFTPVEGEHGTLYRVPEWSNFAEKEIAALESESPENR